MRALAEFVFRAGDLYSRSKGKTLDMRDGLRVQEIIRKRRFKEEEDYASEVSVKRKISLVKTGTVLSGRIDGLITRSNETVIEEYKACAQYPTEPNLVDLGQVLIYAGLFSLDSLADDFTVSLVYVDFETFQERPFQYHFSGPVLHLLLKFVLVCYETWLKGHSDRTTRRRDWMLTREFPFDGFRYGQRALAGRVYQAAIGHEKLLIESPTGSGKTIATIYPVLKSMGDSEKLFYLTSRNAGSLAALSAIKAIDSTSSYLVLVELIAKKKLCPVEGMPCDPELCLYAKNYFDRSRDAVKELVKARFIDQAMIRKVSEDFKVCPFEISLDASLWADVIVCDYNYVFDPFVRLQRFQPPAGIHLLIDEAHQLFPRVNSMHSLAFSSREVDAALEEGNDHLGKGLTRLAEVIRRIVPVSPKKECQIDFPEELWNAIDSMLLEYEESSVDLMERDALKGLVFQCYRWRAAKEWGDRERFVCTLEDKAEEERVVRYVCVDSSSLIKEILDTYESSISFSGTLSPLKLYQGLHGGDSNLIERSPNPFKKNQLKVLIVDDIPTYFQSRGESLHRLVTLVGSVLEQKPGRYLIAFPSFAYLDSFWEEWNTNGLTNHGLVKQGPGIHLKETKKILTDFSETDLCLLGVVLGGIFGESIDFFDSPISGVFVVSIGLPPPSLERDLMAEHFAKHQNQEIGQTIAYRQPALNKVLQVCGRLIRSEKHKGMIYLVDPRYNSPKIREFFPAHWSPSSIKFSDAARMTKKFWG